MDYSHQKPLVAPSDADQWIRDIPGPIAVTGGTGFVGSHLVDSLCAAGVEPRVLVRQPDAPRWIEEAPVAWIEGALDDRGALDRLVRGAGTVIHMAGVLRASREVDFDLGNRGGTQNLIDAIQAEAPSAHLVHVSSLAAVGPCPEPAGWGPDASPAPLSWYGKSKLAAEKVVTSRVEAGRRTIVRPPAIYGPRDSDIFEFFRMAQQGLVAFPAGERWLTVSWVGDVVRAILSAAVGDKAGIYHLGEAEPVRLDGMLQTLAFAGGVKPKIVKLPSWLVTSAGAAGSLLQKLGWRRLALTRDKTKDLLATHWTALTRESNQALGLDPVTIFADGARITWSWYRDQGWLKS